MQIAGVRFNKVGKLYHFDSSHLPQLQPGDHVIVETARGKQMGQVMAFIDPSRLPPDAPRTHKPIERVATPRDLILKQIWEAREAEALVLCREKVKALGLDMKVIRAEFSFDGTLLTYYYSTESKVDTKNLRRELQHLFPNTLLELRQIGPRDVAKLLGGFGACGIMRCCSTHLTEFSPISIKMAKEQGISLNPSEITGMCGRLRCCLVYEYEQYVEARKQLPKRGKRVRTPQGEGKVVDQNPLRETVFVQIEETIVEVHRSLIDPLDELEALVNKASAPCEKHESGQCDCGARRTAAQQAEELLHEMDEEVK